jgi:hypothetical protein
VLQLVLNSSKQDFRATFETDDLSPLSHNAIAFRTDRGPSPAAIAKGAALDRVRKASSFAQTDSLIVQDRNNIRMAAI